MNLDLRPREKAIQSHNVTQNKATDGYTRPLKTTGDHTRPHKAIRDHTRPYKATQVNFLFSCTLFVPFGTFFIHVSTPRRRRTTIMLLLGPLSVTRGQQIVESWRHNFLSILSLCNTAYAKAKRQHLENVFFFMIFKAFRRNKCSISSS